MTVKQLRGGGGVDSEFVGKFVDAPADVVQAFLQYSGWVGGVFDGHYGTSNGNPQGQCQRPRH